MKFLTILVCLLMCFISAQAQAAQDSQPITILVTSFDYFNDPPVNSSHTIAKYLEKSPALKANNIKIAHCADLETKFKNKNIDRVLDPNQPDYLPSTLPLAEMYCANNATVKDPQIKISTDAGFITCNNLAFRMAAKLNGSNIPYGFIHVPRFSRKCTKNNPTQASKLIEAMVVRAANTLRVNKNNNHIIEKQPMTLTEVEKILRSAPKKSSCEQDFYTQLEDTYKTSSPPKSFIPVTHGQGIR